MSKRIWELRELDDCGKILKLDVIYADEIIVKNFPTHGQKDIHFNGVSFTPESYDKWIKFGEELDDALRHWSIGDGVGYLVNVIHKIPGEKKS